MRGRINALLTLAIFTICGFIGYSTNYTQTVKATVSESPPAVVIFNQQRPAVPGFNIDLNLNDGKAVVSDTVRAITINVTKKDSIITRWKTSVVEKPVYVRVRELPAMRSPKPVVRFSSTELEVPKTISID